jgi:hypothetical protein
MRRTYFVRHAAVKQAEKMAKRRKVAVHVYVYRKVGDEYVVRMDSERQPELAYWKLEHTALPAEA